MAGSQLRSQEDRQTEMDQQTACQLLVLCHFRQFALGRAHEYQQDPRVTWMELQVLDIGSGTGTENDGADSANFELFICGVPDASSPHGKL